MHKNCECIDTASSCKNNWINSDRPITEPQVLAFMCGIAAAIFASNVDVVGEIYEALNILQHRGQVVSCEC